MEAILAQPRGFCAGVVRAIEIVERALQKFGAPVYVYHEIVHNRYVVNQLREKGAIFVDDLDAVPQHAHCVFSAHGVSRAVVAQALARNLQITDAACPLVTKVHNQARRYQEQGLEVLIIGHQGHPEVEGTRGQLDSPAAVVGGVDAVARLLPHDPSRLAYVTQTTLSLDDTRAILDALAARFPTIQGPDVKDICYATQNRQNAVRALAAQCNVVLVVGSANSSNSNRLCEVARYAGCQAHLIENADEVQSEWLDGVEKIGITAGASAPEVLVEGVIERLRALGVAQVHTLAGEPENTVFRLPENFC